MTGPVLKLLNIGTGMQHSVLVLEEEQEQELLIND
jgi:hypothetical protein